MITAHWTIPPLKKNAKEGEIMENTGKNVRVTQGVREIGIFRDQKINVKMLNTVRCTKKEL